VKANYGDRGHRHFDDGAPTHTTSQGCPQLDGGVVIATMSIMTSVTHCGRGNHKCDRQAAMEIPAQVTENMRYGDSVSQEEVDMEN
jgi:hypothetical protein